MFFLTEIRTGLEIDFVEFGVSLFSSGANLFGFFLLFLLPFFFGMFFTFLTYSETRSESRVMMP